MAQGYSREYKALVYKIWVLGLYWTVSTEDYLSS